MSVKKTGAVGTFDGVHLGHAAVLEKVKEMSRLTGTEPVVFTFDRHPLEEIDPSRAPLSITTVEKKQELIKSMGVTPVVLPFDATLRVMTAEEWMRHLHDTYSITNLVAGYDNTFGSDGVGMSLTDYRNMGKSIGIEVDEAPVVEGISSSAIRKAIARGEMESVRRMLGRRWMLPGIVVEGNRLGRTIGFPTANLNPSPGLCIPSNGVYSAWALLPDGKRKRAVVNIGTRPTVMRGDQRTIEAHIIDWNGNLYGKNLKLLFQDRLRDEMRFGSIDALRQQIEKDCIQAEKMP